MAKDRYDPRETEKKWQEYWDKERLYAFNEESDKEVFSIDTPPPYASADHLHVGHGMSYSHIEFVARYQRMKGKNVFFPIGFDDNGLPTERFVEQKHKIHAPNVKRSEFVTLCLEETEKAGKTYHDLFNSLGFSIDWSLLYHTIGKNAQRTAQKSFIDLFKKEIVTREKIPQLVCPHCQTSIAQADLDDTERSTTLNHIVVKVDGTDETLTFATTRPELMMACIAVSVHPDDDRYKHLVGKNAVIPGSHAKVPIIADTLTKMEFGTGVVYWCPYGDTADIEFVAKHPELEVKHILNADGRLNEHAEKYEGMTCKDARAAVLEEWKEEGALIKQEFLEQTVNVHERCKTPVEFIVMNQWSINVLDFKEKLLEQGKKITWRPDHMRVRYNHWVEGLKWNWGISRQRHFGIPFPVWYCKTCEKVLVPDEKSLPVDPRDEPFKSSCSCGSQDIIPEMDVMDTWMTSSVTPEINAEWGSEKERKDFLPMSLRPQAHDIIRTWAFYTIVKAFHHYNNIPWYTIMISGHGLDSKGKKMSKSANNFVVAQDMIKKYSADAFRFWAAGSKLGEDVPFQEKELLNGQKTITKLYNAAKFVFMHVDDFDKSSNPDLAVIDSWLLSQLQRLIKTCTYSFDEYDYSKTRQETEKFFWHVFCDDYLEIVKDRLYNDERKNEKVSAQYALYYGLYTILQLFSPIMPHITEELYQKYYAKDIGAKSIHITSWPKEDDTLIHETNEKIGNFATDVVRAARAFKSQEQVSLKTSLNAFIKGSITAEEFLAVKNDIVPTMKAQHIEYSTNKVIDTIKPSVPLYSFTLQKEES